MLLQKIVIIIKLSFVLIGLTPKAVAQVPSKILVKEVEIVGNTVFTDAELRSVITPLPKSPITLEELSALSSKKLTDYYVDRGYIGSGAFIPPQKFVEGKIQIQIIESTLSAVEIEGLSRLKDSYIRTRLPELDRPLNIQTLARSLAKLQNDPLIEKLKGEIIEQDRGSNILLLSIEEAPPFNAALRFTNSYSSSIGNFGGSANISHNNLLGFGDRLSLNRSQTEGLRRTEGSYSIPLNSLNGRVSFGYTTAKSEIVAEELQDLDIEADYDAFVFDFRQPIISNLEEEFTLSIGLKHIDSETFVLSDLSFGFTEGLENGESILTVLNLSQEYSKDSENSLLAIRSQFDIGLDAFNTTQTEVGIDGIFWKWQGDFQYFRALNENRDTVLTTRILTQLTPDKLLPIEQFTLGGTGSIRGYRRNIENADNGVLGTIELQLPLTREKWGNISILPFFDIGTIWNSDRETIGSDTFASVGLGLRYQFESAFEARIDYGIPLMEAEGFGTSETTDNFTFSLIVRPLRF